MTTVIDFRLWRSEAAAARAPSSSTARAASDSLAAGADIILMPLAWLAQLGRESPRKPLKRRFTLREVAPA
jgi:hypothetical protein